MLLFKYTGRPIEDSLNVVLKPIFLQIRDIVVSLNSWSVHQSSNSLQKYMGR